MVRTMGHRSDAVRGDARLTGPWQRATADRACTALGPIEDERFSLAQSQGIGLQEKSGREVLLLGVLSG